jgi:hypothetical protein
LNIFRFVSFRRYLKKEIYWSGFPMQVILIKTNMPSENLAVNLSQNLLSHTHQQFF